MCLVEVEQSPKPVAACAMNVMPNMKINTKSEKTRIARGGVMEFLLANHPLDCPICDQGGECDLQDISQVYGYRDSRHQEYKLAVEDKYIGPLIKMIMTRCIACTRCVRFTEQIGGEFTLGTTARGESTEISTYVDAMVTNELSANAADLCPVGALTHMPYTFKARPWELKANYSIDVSDSIGANIEVYNRGTEMLRILPRVNEDVNEEWVSDKGRHMFDGLKRQRLSYPMRRNKDGQFDELRWEEALAEVANAFEGVSGDEIVGLVGPHTDAEAIVAFRDFMHRLGSDRVHSTTTAPKVGVNLRSDYLFNSRLRGIDDCDYLLMVGTNLRTEAPTLNTRVLKNVEDHGLEVNVIGYPSDLNYDYDQVGTSPATLEQIANGDHPVSQKLAEAERPMIIVGGKTLTRTDGEAILNNLKRIAEGTKVVDTSSNWNGLNILHESASTGAACDIGIPQYHKGDLKQAKVVYIMGHDDFREEDIPEDATVIYQGAVGDEGVYYADIILPGAGYTEKLGTYVNTEGRVQQTRAAVQTPVQAKQDWQILRALSEQMGSPLPYDNVIQVRDRLAELAPHLVRYDHVEPYGFEDLSIQHRPGSTQMSRVPFSDPIDNFYMTEAVSRNSKTMANCTRELNPLKHKNFRAPEYDFAGR